MFSFGHSLLLAGILTCQLERQRIPGSAKRAGPSSIPSAFVRGVTGTNASTHNDVIAPSFSEHVGDQLGRDGCPRLVLFVLSSVREMGHDSGDSACRGDLELVRVCCFAVVDHVQENEREH